MVDAIAARPSPIDDAGIARLAQVAKIPADRIPLFSSQIGMVFFLARFPSHDTEFDNVVVELDRLIGSATEYQKALRALDDAARARLEFYNDELHFDDHLESSDRILQAAISARGALSRQRKRQRGRRSRLPGGSGATAMDVITWRMLELINRLGGKLTFDRRAETGTLIVFLQMIRDYVPPDCIPDPLPLARLDQLKRYLSKNTHAKI
jgi:hypothetical protein